MSAGSLANILNKGSESLENSRAAIDVSGHNISNAHTPGYSRQIVNLETKDPIQYGLHIFGQGARIQSIARVHDSFLESQIQREVQVQNKTDTLSKGLQKLEGLFNPDLTSTIRDRLVSFSNAVRELSNSPEEPAVRINVIENGKALSQAFNASYAGVLQIQVDSDESIHQNITSLNEKLVEIAQLNAQVREMSAGEKSGVNDLEDKQDKLVKEVGELIDINVYKDNNNQITVRGPNESLLVEGRLNSRLSMENNFSVQNRSRILVSEFDKPVFTDVTEKLHKGKIGALVELRDVHAQRLRESINTLAKGFGEQFNSIHEAGYGIDDLANKKGRPFFAGLNGPGEAGQNIAVDMTIVANPSAVSAAMSPETFGDNVVANKLVKLFYDPCLVDKSTTLTGFYDKMISQLGHDTAHAKEEATASLIVYDKLKAQRESHSGVSLDEEAANLLKYQHLFNASSKIITTANEMFQTVLDLKR
ncbi:MAG: flagellar hook-associated protein FlgK [Bdellovibrionota bacterium]